jgi:phosphate:Na+ symporter
MDEVSSLDIILRLLGGLGLFLFAMGRISETLAVLAVDRVRLWLERCTSNAFLGVLVGTFATVLLDSSSAVIILVIAFVNAGALRSDQALGVVLGANIGTTMSSQLFALDIDRFAPLVLCLGLVMQVAWRQGELHQTGRLLLDFGLLFFGLSLMGLATEPLRDHPRVVEWLKGLEEPLQGALGGALVTLVIQSSSATLGIAIQMVGHGVLNLPAGVAVMMGAEIGTCADTLLATLGRTRAALRVGVFHLAFNILSVTVGLLLFPAFLSLVRMMPGSEPQQLANAHVLFNTIGVIVIVWFTRPAAALLRRIIPDRLRREVANEGEPEDTRVPVP